VAHELGIRLRDVELVLQVGNGHVSLDGAGLQERGETSEPAVSADPAPISDISQDLSVRNEVSRTLERLDSREREIIQLYYGIGHETAYTLEEIGLRYNLTRERVRQIKETAIAKLKRSASSKLKSCVL
jgi:RNA polymerase primary sigma factor